MKLTIPVTYKITDYNGEEIQGAFYEQELQKTKQDMFRIEKIIKQQGNKSNVKWLGYNDSFNSWVDNKDIKKFIEQESIMFAPSWSGFHKFSRDPSLMTFFTGSRQWLDSQFSPRLHRTTVRHFKHDRRLS